jgi:hypothetical protein
MGTGCTEGRKLDVFVKDFDIRGLALSEQLARLVLKELTSGST